jgi:2-phospho-L-lactate guanylyltransferase
MHAIVIPFRGPGSAKSRLASGITDTARRQIARGMFQHVLNVACEVSGPRRVLVVTASKTAAVIARRCGAGVLRETAAGYNEAVAEAIEHLRTRGATTAAVVAADLPLLKASNLAVLERCGRDGNVGIAPDRSGGGTNALTLPLSLAFKFHFGADSLYRHQREGRRLGATVRLVRQAGLASDVDTPDDLDLLVDPAALSTLPRVGKMAYRGSSFAGAVMNAALYPQERAEAEIGEQCFGHNRSAGHD